MEQNLKITSVLSDPTRYNIYQTFLQQQKPMTVLDIAEQFNIHPNVARLHLSKLSSIQLLNAEFEKSKKGGRPRRIYELSNQVIELTFPHRDYKLLAHIMLETFMGLGDIGEKALYRTGKSYGREIVEQYSPVKTNIEILSSDQKLTILESTGKMLGMYPHFEYVEEKNEIIFHITNCPFKEIAEKNHQVVCRMHNAFLKGMLSVLFENVQLVETENMFKGCSHCSYVAKI